MCIPSSGSTPFSRNSRQNMTQKVRSNVYLDTELKELAREMFKNYGLSLSDGINFLLKQATEKKLLS